MLISNYNTANMQEKIKVYEKTIGQKLPQQLYTFLIKYNGGETPNTSFNYHNASSDVIAFYGLGNVNYSLDNVNLISYKNKCYLPCACDSFGNEIAIELHSGEIYFMNHENEQITKLTDDLRHFIASCESKGINPNTLKSVEEREQALIAKGRGSIVTDNLRNMWKAEIEKYSSMKQEEVSI